MEHIYVIKQVDIVTRSIEIPFFCFTEDDAKDYLKNNQKGSGVRFSYVKVKNLNHFKTIEEKYG